MRRTPYAVLLAVVLAGCAAAPVAAPQPVTSPIRPVERRGRSVERSRDHDRSVFSAWDLGAHPLPLRADGFGEVRPPRRRSGSGATPRSTGCHRLPPPADGPFRTLYAARFPVEEMRLPTTADLEAPPTGDGNNTAGLVCRATRGATGWRRRGSPVGIGRPGASCHHHFRPDYRGGTAVPPPT